MRNLFQNYRQLLNDLQIILNDSPTINKEKRSNQANQNNTVKSPLTKQPAYLSRFAGCGLSVEFTGHQSPVRHGSYYSGISKAI